MADRLRARRRWIGRAAVSAPLSAALSTSLSGALVAAWPTAPAAAAGPLPTGQPVQLPAARQFDLQDTATGRPYRIFIAEPEGPAPPDGHPVLCVLDGNAAFPVAAFLARGFASRREVTGHAPVLVVGIGYPGEADFDVSARQRDYTPSVVRGGPGTEGEADRFLDFIDRQVRPLVARQRPTDPRRQALFGHSLGGLLVLHALASRPQAWSTWLASSPSLWWDRYRLLERLPAQAVAADARLQLQISVGALEDDLPAGPLAPDLKALLAERQMVGPARELARRLRERPDWRDRVVFHELADEDHGPVWLPALSRGFRLLLARG